MKNVRMLIVAGIAGIAGSVLSNLFLTRAQASAEDVRKAVAAGQCVVETNGAIMTGGMRCYRNTVMTGIWNDNLYCSELVIRCDGGR